MLLSTCSHLLSSIPRRINGSSASSVRFLSNKASYSYLVSKSLPLALSNNMNCCTTTAYQSSYNYQRQYYAKFSTKTSRRRRRGTPIISNYTEENDGASNNEDISTSSSPSSSSSMSSEQFLIVANSLLDKVESAMIKLMDCNDGLEVTRYPPSTTTSSSNDDGDNDENQNHAGQLSIQIESSGDLYYGGGTYWLTVLPNNDGKGSSTNGGGYVTLQSPLSGQYSYVYNVSNKEWVGGEDGHSLLGMLTRDWIRQAKGVPDF